MVERLEIKYSRKFVHSLDSQMNILFREKIIDSIDYAEKKVEQTYDFIENNIEKFIETPQKLASSGKYYLRFMIDDNLTWFLFFNREGEKIIMTHLLNNQSPEFSKL